MKRLFTLLAFVAFIAVNAIGQGTTWRADKSHSKLLFTIRHLVISEVVGYFKEWEMKITASKDD